MPASAWVREYPCQAGLSCRTRRSDHRIHSAATMSRPNAIGPVGLAWLVCNSQPNASSTTSGGHHIFLLTSNAAAAHTQATNTAQEPVRLKNEPTPPNQGSTQGRLIDRKSTR